MLHLKRVLAFALLLLGVALVFLGLTSAQGFTVVSVAASLAAIAALLYTGGVWFGAAAPRRIVSSPAIAVGPLLFDARSVLVGGPTAGQPLTAQFPERLRPELERHCAAALAGRPSQFQSTAGGHSMLFEALPIRGADGTIVYGLLVFRESPAVAATA